MSCTIGRMSFTNDPNTLDQSGDSLTIGIDIVPSTLAEAKVMRHQLVGLADNPDEVVVPFTWSLDSTFDGFYEVISASAEPTEAWLVNSLIRCTIELRRVANGFTSPVFELAVASAVRTNSVGITDGEIDGVVAWRQSDAATYGELVATGTTIVRAAEDGDIRVTTGDAPTSLTTGAFYWSPSTYYNNAAVIERQVSSVWYPVVGRQATSDMAGNWRISNGLIRITASGTNVGDLKVEIYDAGWKAMETELRYGQDNGAGTFTQGNAEGGFATGYDQQNAAVEWAQPHIIRNDKDTVIIGFRRSSGYTQTFTLHAGDYLCEFYAKDTSLQHAIRSRSNWSTSSISGAAPYTTNPGLASGLNDANGNTLALLYVGDAIWVKYSGASSPSGFYQGSASTSLTAGIGVIKDGTGAASGNAARDIADQFVAVKSWKTYAIAQ